MFRRSFWTALALIALCPASRATDDSLARYDHVAVGAAKSSIYIGTVKLTLSPASRQNAAYECTYSAEVFPYFFMSETGRLRLDAPDATLRRLAQGESVEFKGTGVSADGEKRRFEGRAVPADAATGRLTVRVFVSKRISLAFETDYRFEPTRH